METRPASKDSAINIVFLGPNGVRAGWRLLVAVTMWLIVFIGVGTALHGRQGAVGMINPSTPEGLLSGELTTFLIYLCIAWIMGRIEARKMRDYGIGLVDAFGAPFWLCALAGFASISVLLFSLHRAGVYQLGERALAGFEIWKYGAAWGLAFLGVALTEETLFRGYALFTLSTGINFWPAAIACSFAFGTLHLGNSGEGYVGAVSAGAIGFLFCILLRKTGNLWAAIGFHAAWDWGESFFYGVPDSGQLASGHLFSAQIAGPVWLTGGSVGPEGSWFCLILVAILCAVAASLPGVKYPDPDAIPDPRRRRVEPPPGLFPESASQS
jgi:membrane protease YdiL (CAAX protease family)